ncbi:uncharacterized protein LOC125776329 [Bactrocera dorsalis]|uniref:Uncharacterized protein LOC125776329 n=1 Tax=Bactrocera dorsalis TaxID=27457 RepID=A0ABM3J480_BACDO|nr:uncharacterized protein LOC125776329 [Bactrocera dorsalis]
MYALPLNLLSKRYFIDKSLCRKHATKNNNDNINLMLKAKCFLFNYYLQHYGKEDDSLQYLVENRGGTPKPVPAFLHAVQGKASIAALLVLPGQDTGGAPTVGTHRQILCKLPCGQPEVSELLQRRTVPALQREAPHNAPHRGEYPSPPPVAQNHSWSEQISSDDALSIDASDPGTETRPLQPEPEKGALLETGAETRPFRPSQRGETETRTFRPLLQHERRTHKRRLRRRQAHNPARLETRSLQLHRASSFRAGLTNRASIEAHSLLPMTAILPTAVVKIEARGRLHLIRALIDACAPTSLIARDLARELQLEQTHIGGQRGCLLVLRGRHGTNTRISTHVRVMNDYMRISPTTTLDCDIAAPYTHIKLADPNFYKSSPIRLVLGADVYSRIMTQQVMPQTFGQLLAQGSIFGWVLSGTARY